MNPHRVDRSDGTGRPDEYVIVWAVGGDPHLICGGFTTRDAACRALDASTNGGHADEATARVYSRDEWRAVEEARETSADPK